MRPTPVALFAYQRPDILEQVLASLRENEVPRLYVFSDGPASTLQDRPVQQVRQLLKDISWCPCIIVERKENMGLGRSIMAGVRHVLDLHESIIVCEDDLVCVPGTYTYLHEALCAYEKVPEVLSVTAWTHPDLVPPGTTEQPYFDGRSSSWLWGCWRRSWAGMNFTASQMIRQCRLRGIDPRAYGCDLYRLARYEEKGNTWAVRFMYNHIRQGALSMHPPHSLVEHIGLDEGASNHRVEKRDRWLAKWGNPPLRACPPLPDRWPDPVEDAGQKDKWQDKCGRYRPQSVGERLVESLRRKWS